MVYGSYTLFFSFFGRLAIKLILVKDIRDVKYVLHDI